MTAVRFEDVLPEGSLALALHRGGGRLGELLGTVPASAAIREAAARDLPREPLVAALEEGLGDLDAPPEAFAAAARLADPASVVVVAGQQPGLFGGPLMVLSKALAAAALARRLERETGASVVPVFWHASEDHDHAEADHVSVGGLRGTAQGVERLRVALPEDGTMLSETPVPAAARDAVERIEELLAGGGLRAEIGDLAPRPGDSMGSWSGRLLARLLGPLGVVVVEPRSLRAVATQVVRHELERPGELAATLERAAETVRGAGFAVPLELRRPELVFLAEDGVRVRFRLTGDRYEDDSGTGGPVSDLLARLGEDPAAFSWNVAARVLAQDVALPVAAQLCGPSELGYVALMREAHGLLGIPQPAAVLRPGVTLLDRRVARACSKLGVEPADVVRRGEAAFPAASTGAEDHLDSLRDRAGALPEGRSPAVRRRRAALLREIELYSTALAKELGEADEVSARRRRDVLAALRPGGRLQERVLSPLPWLAEHGTGLLRRIRDAFEAPGVEHVLLAPGKED